MHERNKNTYIKFLSIFIPFMHIEHTDGIKSEYFKILATKDTCEGFIRAQSRQQPPVSKYEFLLITQLIRSIRTYIYLSLVAVETEHE